MRRDLFQEEATLRKVRGTEAKVERTRVAEIYMSLLHKAIPRQRRRAIREVERSIAARTEACNQLPVVQPRSYQLTRLLMRIHKIEGLTSKERGLRMRQTLLTWHQLG